jgi:hypothetical protein
MVPEYHHFTTGKELIVVEIDFGQSEFGEEVVAAGSGP